MNPTWAPTDLPAATRGEFLAARATAVRELERSISSPFGLLLNCGLVLVAIVAVMMAGAALSDIRVETFHVVFAVVMTAAALATVPPTVRRALRTRRLMDVLLSWEAAERQARSLPSGHIGPGLRMPFDARQDPDFDSFAYVVGTVAEFRPSGLWLTMRAIPAGSGIALGIALVLGGPGTEPAAQGIAFSVSGAYLLICCLVCATGMFRTVWRLTLVWRTQKAEIQAWRIERFGPVVVAEVDRARRRKRALMVAPSVLISVLALVVWVRTNSAEVVGISVAIVVLGGLVTGVVLLVRRYRRRAAAHAEHDLTSVPPASEAAPQDARRPR